MDNWFQSKWFIRVLALAFAITLFIFVDIETNTTQSDSSIPGSSSQVQTLDDVPVDIHIDSENYVVSGVPEYAAVSLEGTPAVIMPAISNRNFSVFVDLEDLEEGDHQVELQHDITSDIRAYIEPKTINVTIEERANEEFPITVDFLNTDQLPTGYEMGDYVLDDPTVEVTTSRSIMEQISLVRVYVDVAGLDSSIENREIPINVYDNQGNELNVRLARETAVISVELLNPSKIVPVSVETTGELPDGFSLESISANVEEMEIFAVSDVLEQINVLNTVEVDLSEVTESGTMEVPLNLPEDITVEESETVIVTIELEEEQTLEGLTIEEDGLEAGQTVTFAEPTDGEMNLTVTGNQSIVNEMSAEDFHISINLSNLGPGEYPVPISIEWDETEGVEVTGEYEEASITIE